jgi:hypothetical protein
MFYKAFLLGVVFLIMPLTALSYDNQDTGTLSIVVENDIFHSDRYYTNGVRASWLSKPGKRSEMARRAARSFPFFPEQATVQANYAIGQNMYTPKDITLPDPPENDRPYAGWVYGSVGLIAETGNWLDQLELTIGMVGPVSLAEHTQANVHKLIGSDDPKGWEHQLKNEPGVILTYQRSWRSVFSGYALGMHFDLTPHAGGALGNIFTYANSGFMMRYGNKLPLDYGPPRIEPSLPGSGYFIPQQGIGWYIFAGLEGRAVARNIFLDGNTFSHSPRVSKEPLVGDLELGVAVTVGNIRLSYTRVTRTREFESQDSKYQNFGAISLSMQF